MPELNKRRSFNYKALKSPENLSGEWKLRPKYGIEAFTKSYFV